MMLPTIWSVLITSNNMQKICLYWMKRQRDEMGCLCPTAKVVGAGSIFCLLPRQTLVWKWILLLLHVASYCVDWKVRRSFCINHSHISFHAWTHALTHLLHTCTHNRRFCTSLGCTRRRVDWSFPWSCSGQSTVWQSGWAWVWKDVAAPLRHVWRFK